jgi:2-isopropylmalate synthase
MNSARVRIFDTTLRDGEQSPGIALSVEEKLQIARALAALNVDIIEAGFPAASNSDVQACQRIAREIDGPVICGLARAQSSDIIRAWEAIRDAATPRIHTFIATSDLHIIHKLQTTRADVKGQARAAVSQARELCDDVQFSPEDASRSEPEFVAEVCQIAVEEGATTINIPDTVGYAVPAGYAELIQFLRDNVACGPDVIFSAHCHNDLGLAVANSIAAIDAGVRQVECAINGIGERAGNTALEELVMLLATRYHHYDCAIEKHEIARTSRLVSQLTGYPVAPNKAIVGRNAFAHEAGIHQHGILKDRRTYEIMDAASIGLEDHQSLILGKHSGRHALHAALETLGVRVSGAQLNNMFARFKELAERKGELSSADIEALAADEIGVRREGWTLDTFEVHAGNTVDSAPQATVHVLDPQRGRHQGHSRGDGAVDALLGALSDAVEHVCELDDYQVRSVGAGTDALGEVSIRMHVDGRLAAGHALSTDIVEASGQAFLRALNAAL